MTAPNRRQSAYPASVAALVPEARKLAVRLGELPSRNRLMTELHIGAPKARDILAELRRLRLVPGTGTQQTDTAETSETGEVRSDDTGTGAGAEPESDAAPDDETAPAAETEGAAEPESTPSEPVTTPADPDTTTGAEPEPVEPVPDDDPDPVGQPRKAKRTRVSVWPVLLLTLPAFAAVWSGWVSLGGMAGFGVVHPLPGIADHLSLNTAITLPIGVEVYAAYALWVWLSAGIPQRARKFARTSAIASLITGAAGQVTYHLLSAAHYSRAPWPVTMLVACLPVAVLGMGAALAHLVRDNH